MAEYADYETAKAEFEKKCFKVKNPFCFCEINEKKDELIYRKEEEFAKVYKNVYYFHEEVVEKVVAKKVVAFTERTKRKFVVDWMQDIHIRTYEEVDFLPCEKADKTIYNLWNGWESSKLPPTDLKFEDSLIYQHIKYLFGDVYEYELDKLAYMLQTGKRTEVLTLLFSKPGLGKDTYLNYIGNSIFGKKYYLNEDHLDTLFGNFNTAISKKVIININEGKKAKLDEIIEAIKNSITRDSNTIRTKMISHREESNHITFYTCTNAHDSIKIEVGDRRFFANEISSARKGDTKYFSDLYKEINSKKYDRACYDFLMHRKIKIKSFQDERPITSYYKDLQERSIPTLAQFLINIMMTEEGKLSVTATDFFNKYIEYLKENGFKFEIT
jgi:hypothetical protein